MGRVAKYKKVKKCDPFSKRYSYKGENGKYEATGSAPRADELAFADDKIFSLLEKVEKGEKIEAPKKDTKKKKERNKFKKSDRVPLKLSWMKGQDGEAAGEAKKTSIFDPPREELISETFRNGFIAPKKKRRRGRGDEEGGEEEEEEAEEEKGTVAKQQSTELQKLSTTVILRPSKRDDETMKEYRRRVSRELRELERNSGKLESRSATKRKAFLRARLERKKQKKGKKSETSSAAAPITGKRKRDDLFSVDDDLLPKDVVRFGEVAQAPPSLPLPKKGRTKQNMVSPLFNQHIQDATSVTDDFISHLNKKRSSKSQIMGHNKASKAPKEFRSLSIADLAARTRENYRKMKENKRKGGG